MTPCSCECQLGQVIYCEQHKCHKNYALVSLCQTKIGAYYAGRDQRGMCIDPDTFELKSQAPMKYPGVTAMPATTAATQAVKTATPSPGSELHKLLARFGIHQTSGCGCKDRAREMNERGCGWCLENIDTITGWMREEAAKRGLPFVETAARMLVYLAVRRACGK